MYSDQTNSSVNSGTAYHAYGYWKLWPAPAHNNAFNHLYYNPMLTYSPPAHDDGTFFDSMDAAHTTNWTQVPVDPWASTVVYADLTANVIVGQWCNSDWSVGHEDDPAYCRTNGVGPTSTSAALATPDGDYLYPSVPSGINPFYNLGYASDNLNAATNKYTIGMSIAYSKVSSTDKSAVNSSVWSLADATGSAKSSANYYENDNVLWCDATAANWPQTGNAADADLQRRADADLHRLRLGRVHRRHADLHGHGADLQIERADVRQQDHGAILPDAAGADVRQHHGTDLQRLPDADLHQHPGSDLQRLPDADLRPGLADLQQRQDTDVQPVEQVRDQRLDVLHQRGLP